MSVSRSSTLVTVKWLKSILASKPGDYRIVDASWHLPSTGRDAKAEYAQQHIPNASFFDIDDCANKDTFLPHMIPSPKVFEDYVGALGIGNETHVVVYDNNPQFTLFSAQRVWWMLRLFGHTKISLLEGGLPKWLSEGGDVTDKVLCPQAQTFKARFNPTLVRYFEDLEKNVAAQSYTVVDARPAGRFKGEAPEPRPDTKSGCIPSSKNIPFFDMMNTEDRTMKSPDEMRTIFQNAGVDLDKPFVVSCGSGVSACVLALAAHMCGKDDVPVYDGSWTEWYHRAPAQLKLNVPED